MLVNKSIETPQGTVVFEGELSEQELDFVLKVGLNFLMQAGAIPMTLKASKSPDPTNEGPDTLQ
jgi:hypothetical protein